MRNNGGSSNSTSSRRRSSILLVVAAVVVAIAAPATAFSPAPVVPQRSLRSGSALAERTAISGLQLSVPTRIPYVRSRSSIVSNVRMCMGEETAEEEMVNVAEQVWIHPVPSSLCTRLRRNEAQKRISDASVGLDHGRKCPVRPDPNWNTNIVVDDRGHAELLKSFSKSAHLWMAVTRTAIPPCTPPPQRATMIS
jgi:hypothetical protein